MGTAPQPPGTQHFLLECPAVRPPGGPRPLHLCVGALEPGQTGDEVWAWRFEHQVVLVAHQTKGVDLPAGLLAGLGQCLEEIMPAHIIEENGFTSVPRLMT